MNLLKRILIAIVGIPIILFLFWKGAYWMMAFLLPANLIANWEMKNILKIKGISWLKSRVLLNSLFFLILCYFPDFSVLSLMVAYIVLISVELFHNRLENSIKTTSMSILPFIYPTIFFSYMFRLRQDFVEGAWYITLLLILIWVTDTFAYFIGMTLGKHRGWIKASPRKSLEGFLGGFIFAMITASIMSVFIDVIPIRQLLLAGISAGVFGQLGDLLESILKRDAAIKDSSSIIPGHGGILDRFDSILIAAPMFYLFLKLFG